MTTQHKVNATHLWYHTVVIVINLLTHLPTKVRDAYHDVALLHVLQIVSPALSLYSRVEIFHALTVMVEDKSFKWRTKSEESYLHSVTFDNGVWFHDTFENCAGEVVVGAYDREIGHLEYLCHVLHSEVELMVAYCCNVILHHVHEFHLYLALVYIIIR